MNSQAHHLTSTVIHLDRLSHNMRLLQRIVGSRPMWPAIKANAYGHGADIVARHLVGLGYDNLCVAQVPEAVALLGAGVRATFVVLSATLPDHAEDIVTHGLEAVVCTRDMVTALDRAAEVAGNRVTVHVKVDTGMGRIGIDPADVLSFLEHCRACRFIHVRGLMSHMPRADEADKAFSATQIEQFLSVVEATKSFGIEVRHMANSAAIFDLPDSLFDAVRPGISIYGLKPSPETLNPLVADLQPVLEWKAKITFLKEVPAGRGLSYGHAYRTDRPSLIATIPVGYGDGLSRLLSNNLDVLIGGLRCPQVGRITMDQSLVDVTALCGRVAPGDEVILIGRQGSEEITADELADRLGTINYEIVTAIASRVPRVVDSK